MDDTFDITLKTRNIFLHYLNTLPIEILVTIPQGFNNTIFWNIKHVIVTQQILVYGLSGLPMNISETEITNYKKGSLPQKNVTKIDIEHCKNQLHELILQTKKDWKIGVFKNYKEYTVTTKTTLTSAAHAIEFNNFHEGIHLGYCMAMLSVLHSE